MQSLNPRTLIMFHKSLEKKRATCMNTKHQLVQPRCESISFGSRTFQAMSIKEHVYLTQSLNGDLILALDSQNKKSRSSGF